VTGARRPSDRLRELYERRAALQYAEPPPLPDPRTDRKWERTLELLRAHLPCEAYLDAGCGDGRFLAALPSLGPVPGRVVGTDISARILATARETARRAGVEPELVQANLEALPFPDGSFDLTLCSQVIEHLEEPDLGLRELARLLRPGGTLIITTMGARALITQTLNLPRTGLVRLFRLQGRNVELPVPELEFLPDDLADDVRRAGLEVSEIETFRFHLRPPLDRPLVRRMCAAIDRRLPRHGFGDIVVVVARRPPETS
jgi:SAM-dependent methyltransferase